MYVRVMVHCNASCYNNSFIVHIYVLHFIFTSKLHYVYAFRNLALKRKYTSKNVSCLNIVGVHTAFSLYGKLRRNEHC